MSFWGGAWAEADALVSTTHNAAASAFQREMLNVSSVRSRIVAATVAQCQPWSGQQSLHLFLIEALHQLIHKSRERHRSFRVLRELERNVHVLLRPFPGAPSPAFERPIGTRGK